MRHRKEINDLSEVEFDLFAKAINQMKKSGMWVNIAKVHAASEKQHYKTHGDPKTFLPWHRKFFVEVENRLQMAAVETGSTLLEACTVTIPYWNWALEENFPQSVTFGSNRLGALSNTDEDGDLNAQFCVKDGRFGTETAGSEFGAGNNPFQAENFMQDGCSQRWGQNACSEFISNLNGGDGSDCIFRKGNDQIFGRRQTLTYAQIVTALREHDSYKGIDNYVAMANFIEREIHNSLHGAVGGMRAKAGTRRRTERNYGHMTSFYSPYDPIFFLHHGFIDFLWSQWQDVHVTGEWRANHNAGDMLNNLLFDGGTDQFPVTDVNMAMDIKDDDPATQEREENVCVKYHERQTNHPCREDWTRIQTCFGNLATYEKLHTVPRIKHFTSVGDVCDPLNKLHFDTDRMWLETMVQAGMMEEDHVQKVLDWERDQLHSIDRTTEFIDIGDGNSTSHCDKALCFSASTMLEICDQCDSKGWALDCHCSVSSQGLTGAGQSCWESRT
jgi:tyrosinase